MVLAESVRRTASKDRTYRFFAVSRDPGRSILKAARRLSTSRFQFIPVPIPDDVWDTTPLGYSDTKDANIRLRLHDILPDLKRVLYLDTDTVAVRDVGILFDQHDAGVLISAAHDLGVAMMLDDVRLTGRDNPAILEFRTGKYDAQSYFNSGVMIFDLSRKETRTGMDEALKLVALDKQSHFRDQDALNNVFAGKVRFIDGRWNWATEWLSDWLECSAETAIHVDARAREPWIVHCTGPWKPWQGGHPMNSSSQYWWTMACSSPFRLVILWNFRTGVLKYLSAPARDALRTIYHVDHTKPPQPLSRLVAEGFGTLGKATGLRSLQTASKYIWNLRWFEKPSERVDARTPRRTRILQRP